MIGTILVLGVFFYVLWVIALRAVYFILAYGKDKTGVTLPQPMDTLELLEFLQEKLNYPDTKDISIDEKGNVVITSRYGVHKLTIENNSLFVERRKRSSYLRKEMCYIEEAEGIKLYIQKAFYPYEAVNGYAWYKNMQHARKRAWIVTSLCCVALVALLGFSVNREFSVESTIQNAYLSELSTETTIGDAFEAFFAEPKWKSYQDGAIKKVDFQGQCLLNDEQVYVTITFEIFKNTLEETSFGVVSCKVNGKEFSDYETYTLLEKVFGTETDFYEYFYE